MAGAVNLTGSAVKDFKADQDDPTRADAPVETVDTVESSRRSSS